jgi:CheY-like chemotaxis protein
MASPALRDRRILVVEDEYLMAVTLSGHLESVGSIVLGPVPSVEKAIKTIASHPHIDAAIVDINLGGVMAYPVADALLARNVPLVFTSGYEDDVLRTRYPQIKNCHKPYFFPDVEQALSSAISGAGRRSHSGPLNRDLKS